MLADPLSECLFSPCRQAGDPTFVASIASDELTSGSLAQRSRGLVSVELMAPPHLFSGYLCVRFAWARRG